jgi:hypothetical protein
VHDVTSHIQILPYDQRLDCAKLKCLQSIVNTKAVFAAVLANLVKVVLNELLLLDKLDIRERLGSELDGL